MQTAVLPMGLELFRYLPWTAVARHMSQGLSPISTTLGKFRWKRCRTNFNEVGNEIMRVRPLQSECGFQDRCIRLRA